MNSRFVRRPCRNYLWISCRDFFQTWVVHHGPGPYPERCVNWTKKKHITIFFVDMGPWEPNFFRCLKFWKFEFSILTGGGGGGASDISHSPLYLIGQPTTAIVSKVSYRGAKRGEVWESGCKDSVYIKVLSLLCDNRKGNTADENNGGNRGR